MQPHEQRVVDEKTELDKKITGLRAFIGTTTFFGLVMSERDLLVEQMNVMSRYSDILTERISRFPQPEAGAAGR